MVYQPDNWVVIRFTTDSPHFRVLGGWSGGYLTGDSWRLNSGITEHEFDGDYWYFYGSSGSCYKCYLDSYGLHVNNLGAWQSIKKHYRDKVTLLGDQEWVTEGWKWVVGDTDD